MRPLLIVLLEPRLQVGLAFLERPIDLLAEHDAVKLVQHRFMEPLTDPIGLEMPRLGADMINVPYGEVRFASRRSGVPQYSVPRSVSTRFREM